MDFGIQHGMGDPAWCPGILEHDAVIDFARTAERAGYAYLAFTDHPAPSGRWADAGGEGVADLFTALGFCAAATERIGLLSWMLVLPYHKPAALAQKVATLDALSGGRVTLGVGTGYLKSEFFAIGADFDTRREAFDRNLAALQSAFGGEDLTVEGPDFSARGVRIMPPAIQRPHPPIWIHGNAGFGLERAARSGDGWVGMFTTGVHVDTIRTIPIEDFDAFERRVAELHRAIERAERAREDVELVATGVVPMLDCRRPWEVDDYRERFERLAALGVGTVILNACGEDPVVSRESIERFASDFIR